MKAESPRWTEVTPSRWPHEKEGLDHVRDNLPDSTPYRAWSNFEFVSLDGTPYEVDLLVLGPAGLHLVELKAWAGRISGDDYDWWEAGSAGGRPISRRNPLPLTNAKARWSEMSKTQAIDIARPLSLEDDHVAVSGEYRPRGQFLGGRRVVVDLPEAAFCRRVRLSSHVATWVACTGSPLSKAARSSIQIGTHSGDSRRLYWSASAANRPIGGMRE